MLTWFCPCRCAAICQHMKSSEPGSGHDKSTSRVCEQIIERSEKEELVVSEFKTPLFR